MVSQNIFTYYYLLRSLAPSVSFSYYSLAIFVGCVESQLLGVTLLYYMHSCFTVASIFDDAGMAMGAWITNRLTMIVLALLFTVPIDLLVSTAFTGTFY